jgi:PAS domain S-box-containing protein
LLSFLKPPVFPDEDQTRDARLLHIIMWVGMLAATLIVVAFMLLAPGSLLRWLLTITFVDTIGFAMVLLNRRGRTRLASIGFIVALWVIFTALSATGGGLRAPAMTAYLVLIPLAGLLVGGKSTILAGAVCTLTGLGLLGAGEAGLLPPVAFTITPALVLAADTLYMVVIVVVQYLSTKTTKDALARAHHEIAERKNAQEALRQSETRLRNYVNVAPVAMAWYNPNGEIEFANHKALELFGYTLEEIATPVMWFQKAYPDPDYREMLMSGWQASIIEAARTGKEIAPIETAVTCKDGSIRFVEISGALVDGSILVAFTDLTDRRRAEDELRYSEGLYRGIFENTELGMFESTPNGQILRVNLSYARMFGFDSPEAAKQGIPLVAETIYVNSEKRAHFVNYALEHPGMARFENEYRRRDGTVFLGMLNLQAITRAEDPFPHLFGFVEDITERRRAESAMRESEQRYREVFEYTSNGIFLIDVSPDNRFYYAVFNPSEKEMTGLSEDLYGKSLDEALPPEVARAVSSRYLRCAETGETISYEERLALPAGVKDFSTTLIPVRDLTGRIYRIVGIANDITEAKRAEVEHRERLARAEMLASVSQALAVVGLDYQAALEVIALQVTREIGDACAIFLVSENGDHLILAAVQHPDARATGFGRSMAFSETFDLSSGLIGRVASTGQPEVLNDASENQVQAVFTPRMANFQKRLGIGSVMAVPMRAQGRTVGVLGLIHHQPGHPYSPEDQTLVQELADRAALTITNARLYAENVRQADLLRQANAELEQKIAERTAELADLYNNAPCGYHSLDQEGRFIQVNDTELKLLGYTREEMLGHQFTDFTTPEGQDIFRKNFLGFVQNNFVNNLDYEFTRKDGTVLPVLLTAVAVRDQDGKFERSLATVVDNSERKQAETQISQLNGELVARAQRLEAINKELESFSYTVSHDLKAPLRGINGYSQLVQEGYADRLDEEGRFFLTSIRKASAQMGRLIDDLLAYSRLERRPMNTSAVELKPFVGGLVAQYGDEIQARHVALSIALPEVTLQIDPDGLGVALRNIIANAFNYTRNVISPEIEMGGEVNDHTCRVWVKDNGIGFDMRYHDRIFEIFQRLEQDDDYPGTGIGLALVRKAIQRLGGKVWAQSKPGEGATFFLEVPNEP